MVRPHNGDFHDDEDHDEPEISESQIMAALLYREIDHHGVQAEGVHELRQEIGPLLGEIVEAVHDIHVLRSGDQWTIPVEMSCGFKAQILIRVADPGPDHSQGE